MGREFFGRSRFAIYNFQMPHPRENYQIAVLRRFPSRRTHHRFPMKLGMLLLQDNIYLIRRFVAFCSTKRANKVLTTTNEI